jgi:uncharacterized repeat protein (TIGR03803 family)
MQKNLWHGALALFVQLTMLALTGCGGGSSSPPPPPPPATTYTVGGNVSGLVANESVTLLNNGGDALIVPGNGDFTFSTNQNADSAYAVTVQSHTPGVACSMSNGSGSVGSSNVTSVSVSCAAGTATILYSFGSGPTDGTNPAAGLIMDSAGNLYGTTDVGGAIGIGTVFKISADGTETVLHSFAGSPTDGVNPQAGLIMDSAGNLYGATNGGGANGFGTVFKISADGAETVLHSFAGSPTDGMNPLAGLIMDSAGNLYGTTSSGGANGDGTVFKISATGTETVLHSFAGLPSDGRKANAGLTMDSAGNLYGTTEAGGLGAYDFGTVFKISVDGTESILFSFSGVDGGEPEAGLIMDSAGNLYGTTSSGGTATVLTSGEVFKISPAGAETVLHFFTGGITAAITDGGYPRAGLIIDSAGNLYGTTSLGGANDEGTVFKISAAGSLSILHSFAGATTDGNEPLGGLIVDSAGNLYGTSAVGGANDAGTAFKIN